MEARLELLLRKGPENIIYVVGLDCGTLFTWLLFGGGWQEG